MKNIRARSVQMFNTTGVMRITFLNNTLIIAALCCVSLLPLSGFSAPPVKDIDWSILGSEDTLTLYFKDTRVGTLYNKNVIDSTKRVVTVQTRIEISAGADVAGSFAHMDLEETRTFDFKGKLASAAQRLKSVTGDARWKVAPEKTGKWLYTVSVAGEEKKQYINPLNENLQTTYTIQQALLNRSVKTGDTWYDTSFELTAGSVFVIKTQCIATPDSNNPCYVFINRDNLINREERYEIDTCGRLLLQEVPPIFVAKRHPAPEEKTEGKTGSTDLYELFVIPKERAQKSSETIAVTLQSGATMHESVQRFFQFTNGQYVEKPVSEKCDTRRPAENNKNKAEWLSSTVTIQSKNPDIIKLADSLKAGSLDRCGVIARFNDYLYRTIEKKYTATFSNASETLKSGIGDCGEHAVLLAALLRAAGVESNVVLGLVYSDFKKCYFFHAWVAVYANRLLFADPALGAFPAAEGYIPLVMDNDGANLVHLAGLIGRIEISYVPKQGGR